MSLAIKQDLKVATLMGSSAFSEDPVKDLFAVEWPLFYYGIY